MPSSRFLALLASWHVFALCGLRSEWRCSSTNVKLFLLGSLALSGKSHPCGDFVQFFVVQAGAFLEALYRLVNSSEFVYRQVFFYGVLTVSPYGEEQVDVRYQQPPPLPRYGAGECSEGHYPACIRGVSHMMLILDRFGGRMMINHWFCGVPVI